VALNIPDTWKHDCKFNNPQGQIIKADQRFPTPEP